MVWVKKLLLSLSVFAIRQQKRLPDGSKVKRWLLGWIESLMILAAVFAVFEVDVLQRGDSRPCDALS